MQQSDVDCKVAKGRLMYMAEVIVMGHKYCWTQSGCSGNFCHVKSGGGAFSIGVIVPVTLGLHDPMLTQPDLQPRSILLLLTAIMSMLLQLLITWLLSCILPKHSHVEHFSSFSIFTLGFSWMGM